jgi:hypothetical protein
VKGHQDSHRAYHRLSLLAQLNVDADDKAREYQQQYGKAHPFVIMSPHAGAFVTTPEGTITAKVVQELRNYATGPPLRSHIQQSNQWTNQIMESINWRAHGKALNGMIEKRVHLTKLVHEILPTYHQLNKYTEHGARKCPACNNADETRDHILRCHNVERDQWRQKFMRAIDRFHDKEDTSPLLRSVWRKAMELWFAQEMQDVEVAPFLFPAEVRQVTVQQNAIGWRQLFNGRFAKAWLTVQNDYLARRQGPTSDREVTHQRTEKMGKQWQKKFIIEIWKQWMVLWKSRNELVHGKNVATQREANRRQLAVDLRGIYDQREHLEPEFQSLLFRDEQEHLRKFHLNTTRNWISTNAPIFRQSLRQAKRRAIAGVRSIRS